VDDQTLEELRNEIRHMDEPELLAFGMQHRPNLESVEYLEAKRKAFELERQQSAYPVDSSWDLQRIVFSNRHRDVFP
jgi:hypothetical protein